MGVFKLAMSVCKDLSWIVTNYWWGLNKGKCITHWKACDKLIQPKCRGGLEFKDFRIFNQGLLARQAWHLLTLPACHGLSMKPGGSLEAYRYIKDILLKVSAQILDIDRASHTLGKVDPKTLSRMGKVDPKTLSRMTRVDITADDSS